MDLDNQDLIAEFVVEANEHLGDIETQLLSIEAGGENFSVDLVNEVFRSVHSVKGASGFLGLVRIGELAHAAENVLNRMRKRELVPTAAVTDTLLKALDLLRSMINSVATSNEVEVASHVQALARYETTVGEAAPAMAAPAPPAATSAAQAPQVALTPAAPEKPAEPAAAASPPPAMAAHESSAGSSPALPSPSPTRAAPAPAAAPAAAVESPKSTADSNVRVSVGVLDKLMNLAGELVLHRNQLLQAAGRLAVRELDPILGGLDQVTGELQDAIMQTRMQPIGNVFGRFPRVVRDISAKLGKQCELALDGTDVEVDKTIIEAIGDPLTHLVRNSIDHGIESPDKRTQAGKSPAGHLILRAYHQAGKVRVDVVDDGAGIDPAKLKAKALANGLITPEQAARMADREAVRLIFHPGFSMAEKVTDISGRGVGMDVVRTNIERLGGDVDVESQPGQGTTIKITLPLTLAIIPSLIVGAGEQRFALPQVNILELVRLRAGEMRKSIDRVGDAEVLRLRGNLLPLVRLADVLAGSERGAALPPVAATSPTAVSIIVVESARLRYGLVVEALYDSEEIVVKPLGRHFQDCNHLAGATILGDGRVALILDIDGAAARVQLRQPESSDADDVGGETLDQVARETQPVLLFTNHPAEQFAIPMSLVARIERIRAGSMEQLGGRQVLRYRDRCLPLLALEAHLAVRTRPELERMFVVVFSIPGQEVGVIAPRIVDIRQMTTALDTVTFREPGVIGSAVLEGTPTRLLNLFELAELACPQWFAQRPATDPSETQATTLLLAEDSGFFRRQVGGYLEGQGYRVVGCEDGQVAWETLLGEAGHEVALVITDIEMPNLNGLELCRRIKDHDRLRALPVIALTSLAGEEDVERGQAAGVDDYQVKMDREQLLASVAELLGRRAAAARPARRPQLAGV